MSTYDKVVKLLAQTDGRDKIYKFLAGLMKVLAVMAEAGGDPKPFLAIGKSIGEGRSLMRLAKWTGDLTKMQTILGKGVYNLSPTNIVEFFRVLGNFGYILGDNVAFAVKYKLVAGSHKTVQAISKKFQFMGFFLATLLDLIGMKALMANRGKDEATYRKQMKTSMVSLTRNLSDLLVTLAAVGYLKAVWNPSATTTGTLTMVSGAVATYQNWNKIK